MRRLQPFEIREIEIKHVFPFFPTAAVREYLRPFLESNVFLNKIFRFRVPIVVGLSISVL